MNITKTFKKQITTTLLSLAVVFSSFGQASIEDEYDKLAGKWLEVSGHLKTYAGLSDYCTKQSYKDHAVQVLSHLHHYDSLVLNMLKGHESEFAVSHKEFKNTIKDIEKFETDYGIKAFVSVLKEGCKSRKELEKDKSKLVNEIGANSYDGQILILESYLRKFLNHIDKKVLAIDDHLHLIHPDQVKAVNILPSSY